MSSLNIKHLLTILSLIVPSNCITTKSVSLTPANPSQNGVTTNLIKGVSNYAPLEFDLRGVDESSFNMQLSLDKSWSFHHKYTTALTLEIGSDTTTDDPTSLLVCFSQNNAKYVTTVIEIGKDNEDILIYPPPMGGKQTYGEGNIKEIVSSNIGNMDRISKATNNGSYGYFEEYIDRPNISYPLIFEIENHPDYNYMIFTYFTPFIKPRNIIYYGMDVNNTLDIYLSVGNLGHNFDITYFNITQTISGIIINNNDILHTTTTLLKQENASNNNKYNDNTSWFDSALVIILIASIVIMCCLFIIFGIMFFKIFHNHAGLKEIQITSPKNPMKNEKPLQVMSKDNLPHHHVSFQKRGSNPLSLHMPSFTSLTHTHSKSNNNSALTIRSTPTLNDILAVLQSPRSRSINNLHENKEDDVNVNDVDLSIIYNEVMRKSTYTDTQNHAQNHAQNGYRKRSDTNTKTNSILYEMDEKNSIDELEESDDSDLELECMYNAPNDDDIRRATVHSDIMTPGGGNKSGNNSVFSYNNINNNNRINNVMNDKLAIDENVNRINIDELTNLNLQLTDMISGDSEALYETGNHEGTPFGSTGTQYENTDPGGITPYTPEVIHMANV